jgi:ketol-acid reductoisomerase
MIGFTGKRDKRIRELEAEVAKLKKITDEDRKRMVNVDLKKQAIAHHLAEIKQGEETKRFQAKSEVSKEIIREMREAIERAVVSIRDLAGRRPNQVTAAHLSALAAEAEYLVQYTKLPR